MTLLKKILSNKLGKQVKTGEFIEIEVDLAMANDITAPIAIKALEKIGWSKLYDKNRIFLVMSHYTPAKDIASANQIKIARDFAIKNDIQNFFDEAQGIEHSMLPELGYIRPAMIVIGADSHSTTYGAFGCFSTGVGSTDIAYIWALGKFWMKVPKELKFVVTGKPGKWVGAKDVILRIIKEIGCDGARYMNMEFTGDYIKSLDMEERMTITNMVIEAGGKSGIIEADDITRNYLLERGIVLNNGFFTSDAEDSEYERIYEINIDGMPPQVAMPYSPDNVEDIDKIKKERVHQVFIGSCTNARITDLRIAAGILKGRKIAKWIKLIVIPATKNVYKQALKEGLVDIFLEAGANITYGTCGPCLGGHFGVIGEDEVCVSTSNRNFPGRMGHPKARVYLCSPSIAAATAVTGYLSTPDEL